MREKLDNTILGLLWQRAAETPDRVALYIKASGSFHGMTWRDVEVEVLRLAAGFLNFGVGVGERVALLSENRFEWILCDLALQWIGAITVPLHINLADGQLASQLVHSGVRLVLASDDRQLKRLRTVQERLPSDLTCLAFDPCEGEVSGNASANLASIQPERIEGTREAELRDHARRHVHAETLATILYTSGTSGGPKGVMLTQRNLAFNASQTYPATGERVDDIKLAFLPLSHIFARTCDVYAWLACGNQLALAESRETVLDDSQLIRPTWMNAVPYFYEKVQRLSEEDRRPGARLSELLGGRIRSCQCGGAAVTRSTYDFFWQHGVPLFLGYGLTEASPVISVSSPGSVHWKAVGKPLPGIEVRLAEDGEILTRGPHVMRGYWRDEAATQQAIRGGWLHTGDLGAWDAGGLLQIRGRKKEVIVTATGHKILPSHLESLLVQDAGIQQAFVTADDRGFPIALLFPNPQLAGVAVQRGHSDPQQWLRQRIDACLAGLPKHEQVRRFGVLPRPLSAEYGELTPKGSLRRDQIARNWSSVLDTISQPASDADTSNLDTDCPSDRIHTAD